MLDTGGGIVENQTTEETLKGYVTQVEFLRFREEINREISIKEVNMKDEVYKVNLANAKVVPLLESIDKSMTLMDRNIAELNESQKDMSKAIGGHTVDIAVLKEVHNSKTAIVEQKKDPEGKYSGLNNALEYKKTIILAIIGVAGTIGVALLNNAEKILSVFGF